MANKKILLVGGGGHSKSVLDSLLALGVYSEVGIIDRPENLGKSIMGCPIVGVDSDLPVLRESGYTHAFVAVGSIGNTCIRQKLFKLLKSLSFSIPSIIDPSATVSKYAEIGEGVFIGKTAAINAEVKIGSCAIINTGSLIEHECRIGSYAHLATGVVLGGNVVIGDSTHVGSNATVRQGVIIGNETLIGSGSVVTKNLPNNIVAYGNPCRRRLK